MSEERYKNEYATDLVAVKLDINVGDKYSSYKEFQNKLGETATANFVRFSKRDSRTIEAARRKIKRPLRPELEFYQLRYSCFFSQKNRPKGTGKRKRKSVAREVEVSCPASIALRATEDGEFLEVYNIVELHNHPVNNIDFKRIIPKKGPHRDVLFDRADANLISEELHEADKYKLILTKCKHIARLGSVSNGSRLQEILKNLDDYIYYLKYTSSKEEIEHIKNTKVEDNNNCNKPDETFQNENIEIIVEADNVMEL